MRRNRIEVALGVAEARAIVKMARRCHEAGWRTRASKADIAACEAACQKIERMMQEDPSIIDAETGASGSVPVGGQPGGEDRV